MKKPFAGLVLVGFCGLLTIVTALWAQKALQPTGPAAQPPPQNSNSETLLRNFAQAYYSAATHHDELKFRSLVLPQSLLCIDAASSIYFKHELSMFRENVKTSSLTAKKLDSEEARRIAAGFGSTLPAPADVFAMIDWKETTGPETNNHPSVVALKKIGDRYLEVIPCPSAAGIQSRNAFFARRANSKK